MVEKNIETNGFWLYRNMYRNMYRNTYGCKGSAATYRPGFYIITVKLQRFHLRQRCFLNDVFYIFLKLIDLRFF